MERIKAIYNGEVVNIKSTREIVRIIAEAAAAKKALDITVLDIRDVSILADYFVICSGSSSTQVKSIADEIKKRMREIGYVLDHVEGYKEEKWMLLATWTWWCTYFIPGESFTSSKSCGRCQGTGLLTVNVDSGIKYHIRLLKFQRCFVFQE